MDFYPTAFYIRGLIFLVAGIAFLFYQERLTGFQNWVWDSTKKILPFKSVHTYIAWERRNIKAIYKWMGYACLLTSALLFIYANSL